MNDNEYNNSDFMREGSLNDIKWAKYWDYGYQELKADGMLEEFEAYIDVGIRSHKWDEWKLEGGIIFDLGDKEEDWIIIPDDGIEKKDVLLLYKNIKEFYKTKHSLSPEENDIIIYDRIMMKVFLLTNMNGANGVMYKNKHGDDLMKEIIKAESQGL